MNRVVLFGDTMHFAGRPLSIYLLASYLKKHNITAQPIWGWKHIDDETFNNLCTAYISKDTLVVGISSTLLIIDDAIGQPTSDFFGIPTEKFRERVELIRKIAHPNCKIVVGGSQITYTNLSTLPEADIVDIFVQGQGEKALLEIVWASINNNQVQSISLAPTVTNDKLFPYNTFTTEQFEYAPQDGILYGEARPIEFARGCIFKCSFCNFYLNGKKPGDYIKSTKTLRNELIRNYEMYGIQHYWSTDDLINDSEEKVDQILEISQSLPFRLQYSGYVRLDLIRRFPSMAAKLKESGLIGAFMGLETINDASGKIVGKGLGRERTEEGLAICNDAWGKKVLLTAGFILGLPKDTPDTKFELLEWLNQSTIRNVITDVDIYPLVIRMNAPPDGSAIDHNPEKFGYKYSEQVKFTHANTIRHRANWRTRYYNYSGAAADSNFVTKEFYKNYRYPKRIDIFSVPYIMSLSENPGSILETMLTDNSSIWKSNKEWAYYINSVTDSHRKQAIDILLQGKL